MMKVHNSELELDGSDLALPRGLVDLPCLTPGSALASEKPQKLAQHLLSQQIWCWGQDIESIHGNLLVRYGFQRIPAPANTNAPSSYLLKSAGTSIVLRGFGVFYGIDRLGGLFLARYGFSPKFTECGRVDRPLFTTADLPPLLRSQIEDESRCRQLLTAWIDWICRYEFWIASEFGPDYRSDSLSRWTSPRGLQIRADEIVPAWQWVKQMRWTETDRKLTRAS